MTKAATKESWTTYPMPEKHSRLAVEWTYSRDEFEKMEQGLIPEVMEDKWFIYHEDGRLNFHRSWTGFCIYQVKFGAQEQGYAVEELLVSRDVEQYQESSDEYDLRLLAYLIDHLLLGKPGEFPLKKDIKGEVSEALYQHHLVGRGKKPTE